MQRNIWVVSACLYYIGRALTRDSGYVKGLVFLRRILSEQPSLLKNTASYFRYWCVAILFMCSIACSHLLAIVSCMFHTLDHM